MEEVDYFDSFSPIAKLTTIRVLLALATINHLHLEQFNVDNAFLHSELNEEVYTVLSHCHPASNFSPPQVRKLHKSIYDLKQETKQWYSKFSQALLNLGYKQSQADYSFYLKSNVNSFTTLLVYVYDIVLIGNCLT